MPDFDVDFCMEKRDQVIEHVAEMRRPRSGIADHHLRDHGGESGYPRRRSGAKGTRTASSIASPNWCRRIRMTLEKAFAAEPQLPEIYEADEEVKALIDMARKLKATRNAGKHAGAW